jgi:hypothetical protein
MCAWINRPTRCDVGHVDKVSYDRTSYHAGDDEEGMC